MEIVCVRHGRTAWNGNHRFQGHTDVPLDDEGRAQASALAAHLRSEQFDLAVASDLSRARATAEAILAGRELTLELDPDLREMRFGVWEGLTWDEIVARYPDAGGDNRLRPKLYTPDGGESFDDLTARVRRAYDRIIARLNDGGRALVVVHAGVLHATLAVLLPPGEVEALGAKFTPAGITRFRRSGERFELVAMNETASPLPSARR